MTPRIASTSKGPYAAIRTLSGAMRRHWPEPAVTCAQPNVAAPESLLVKSPRRNQSGPRKVESAGIWAGAKQTLSVWRGRDMHPTSNAMMAVAPRYVLIIGELRDCAPRCKRAGPPRQHGAIDSRTHGGTSASHSAHLLVSRQRASGPVKTENGPGELPDPCTRSTTNV